MSPTLNAAVEAVYRAWLPYIGEAEAREQAEAFARRFHVSRDTAHVAA